MFCDQHLPSPLGSTTPWVFLSFLQGCCRHWGALWLLPARMAPGSQAQQDRGVTGRWCRHWPVCTAQDRVERMPGVRLKCCDLFSAVFGTVPNCSNFGVPLGASIYKSNKPSIFFCLVHQSLISSPSSIPKEFIFMLSISLVKPLPSPPAGLYLCSQGCFGSASFAESHRSVLLPCLWWLLRWRKVTLI